MKTVMIAVVGAALLIGAPVVAQYQTVPRPKLEPPKVTKPVAPKIVVPNFPGTVQNPVTRVITDKCAEAKPWVTVCNLCQETIAKLKEECQAEKEQVIKTEREQCAETASGSSAGAHDQGVQDGVADLKNKAQHGYIFPFYSGSGSCEAFCSHLRADDGHLMTCVESITTEGGCLSPVRLTPGPCTGHSSDAHCICA